MKQIFLWIIVVFSSLFRLGFGQEPQICSYQLEIDEISNLDIYTILKDREDVLYIGTDQGLFCYKSSKLQAILPAENQKGLSVFQLQMDEVGNVYCCNLNGQVFKVVNGKLSIVYEVSLDNIKSNFIFHVISSEEFIYAARNTAIVKNGVEETLVIRDFHNEGFEWFNLQRLNSQSFFLSTISCGFGLKITDRRVDTVFFPLEFEKGKYPITYSFLNEDQTYYLTSDGQVSSALSSDKDLDSIKGEKYINIDETRIVAANSTSGGRLITMEKGKISQTAQLLPDKFISTCYYDGDVLYLGTFNHGLYICPDLRAIKQAEIKNAIGLKVADQSKIVIANTGEVYNVQDSLIQIDKSPINLDEVFYQNEVSSVDSFLYNKIDFHGYGIIKDLWQVKQGFYFTSNKGLYFVGEGAVNTSWNGFQVDQFDSFYLVSLGADHRYHAVASSLSSDYIMFSDPQGTNLLKRGEHNGELLLFEGTHFISNDVEWFNDQWICATAHLGVLIFEGSNCVKQITTEDGLYSNSVQKIILDDNILYIQSIYGMQAMHLADYDLKNIGLSYGVGSSVRDFDVDNKAIWLLQNNDLISIPKVEFKTQNNPLVVYIDSVLVGGIKVETKDQNQLFSHLENTLNIYFDFRDLITQSEAVVMYQLEGLETTWRIESADNTEISYSSLPPGSYALLFKVVAEGNESQTFRFEFTVDAPYYQKWWFYVLMALVGGLLVFVLVKIYMSRENKRLAQQNELNASKLTAIQSQMNPHFIFNALNSIQDLVLKGDKKNSYTYITKFANLVRRTLNYSDKDLIEFNQEIKLIELYLTLEKLRFKTDFEYNLEHTESEVLVPPMLVQPFIENALVHGLLHKEGLRKLDVHFEFKDHLICTIIDNGVGRKKAEEIKKRQRGEEHESFSVNAIKNRFDILSEYYGGEFGYVYYDLEENGEAVGTRVVLTLPAIRKY